MIKDTLSNSIEFIIENFELESAFQKKNELYALCPFHKDTQVGNFSINLNTGNYFCFSCLAKGNIINLASNKGFNSDEYNLFRMIMKQNINLDEIYFDEIIDKYVIDNYKKNGVSQYALERLDWDYETLEKYEVFSDEHGNPIFLVKDLDGNYRAVWKRDNSTGNYLLVEGMHSKEFGYLFGMHLKPTEKTIVTEGPFDALKVHSLTGYKSVCINGVHISKKQKEALSKMTPLYFMLDGDVRGREAREKIHDQFQDVPLTFYAGKYKGDPDEMSKEQMETVIEESKSWLNYFFDVKIIK